MAGVRKRERSHESERSLLLMSCETRRICFDIPHSKVFYLLCIHPSRTTPIVYDCSRIIPGIPSDLHPFRPTDTPSENQPPENLTLITMADRNLELRRANYKSKSQFNAADVSPVLCLCWVMLGVKDG